MPPQKRLVEQTEEPVFHQIPRVLVALEQFEINFMRDSDPANEIIVWQSIVAAWQAYHEKFWGSKMLPDAQEKKLLGALILISTGIEDPTKLNVSAEVGRRLLQCYGDLGKE